MPIVMGTSSSEPPAQQDVQMVAGPDTLAGPGAKRPRKIMHLEANVFAEDPGLDDDLGEEERRDDAKKFFEKELPHLQKVGRVYRAPPVEELWPEKDVYGIKSGAFLEAEKVAIGRWKELKAMETQEARLVIKRSELPRGTKMVRGRFLDDARGDEVKSWFVAHEVAYEVRDDVHAGTPGLKGLRNLISMAAMQSQCLAIYDITAAFLHEWMDELLAVLAPRGLLADDEVFVPVKALYGTRRASNLWEA